MRNMRHLFRVESDAVTPSDITIVDAARIGNFKSPVRPVPSRIVQIASVDVGVSDMRQTLRIKRQRVEFSRSEPAVDGLYVPLGPIEIGVLDVQRILPIRLRRIVVADVRKTFLIDLRGHIKLRMDRV